MLKTYVFYILLMFSEKLKELKFKKHTRFNKKHQVNIVFCTIQENSQQELHSAGAHKQKAALT